MTISFGQTSKLNGLKKALKETSDARRQAVLLNDICRQHYSIPSGQLLHYSDRLKMLSSTQAMDSFGMYADYYRALYYTGQGMSDSALAIIGQYAKTKGLTQQLFFDFEALKFDNYRLKDRQEAAFRQALYLLNLAGKSNIAGQKITAALSTAIQYRYLNVQESYLSNLYKAAFVGGNIDAYPAEKAEANIFKWLAVYYDEHEVIPDSFNFYLDKAIEVALKSENLASLAQAYNWRANTLVRRFETKVAEPYIYKSDSLFTLLDDRRYDHQRFLLKYDYYQVTNRIDKAIALAKAEIEKERRRPTGRLARLYNTLRITYDEQNDDKNHAAYADSLIYALVDRYEETSAAERADYEAQYKTKERELALIQSRLNAAREKNIRYLYMAVFTIVVFIALFSFFNYKKQQKKRLANLLNAEALEKEAAIQQAKEKERNRISKELHDNIGAQLSYIRSNINFLKEAPAGLSNETKLDFLDKIESTSQTAISDLRETIWVLHKDFVHFEELADKLKAHIERRLDKNISLTVEEDIACQWQMSSVAALNILRIFQEALTNTLKYAQAREIILTIISPKPEIFEIRLRDDGIGFVSQNNQKKNHYGLSNMQERAQDFKYIFNIESVPDNGTEVILTS
ncbi:histidine kinase [Taibaiella lutea]|uniref:histidine kinase n=1 Tax=Taibaiella lutea TaxID=2608001 RepID=UPI00167FDFE6|nr:histidine kinase [Taibaiella lutea]